MEYYELTAIDLALLDKLRTKSEADAPWAQMSAQDWDFLGAGIEAGLDWRIHSDFLEAYLTPSSKAGQKRQESARLTLNYSHEAKNVFPSGIGLWNEHEGGHWRGNGDDDDAGATREFIQATKNVPGTDFQLARLMEVFWPDAPPLVWAKVRDQLVRREHEERRSFYGGTDEYFIDTMDFGRAVRFLTHANRLVPHPKVDWEGVINPPAKPEAGASTTGPRARRKS